MIHNATDLVRDEFISYDVFSRHFYVVRHDFMLYEMTFASGVGSGISRVFTSYKPPTAKFCQQRYYSEKPAKDCSYKGY